MSMNPNLSVHQVYKQKGILEYKRKAFIILSVGSHRLKIETGQWSRIPREARLYTCGSIQDEVHVIIECPLLNTVRAKYARLAFDSVGDGLMNTGHIEDLFSYCHEVLVKSEA